jgi:pimeloyl-ACP methyl ester carboxylesterase
MPTLAKTVKLSNDMTLDFVEQGDPDAVPVLLLHGLGDSWRSYEPVFQHLPRTVRVFALSQRGHGDSSKPAKGYRLEHFVEDLKRFMDAVHVGAAVLAGHSSHGLVSERFAIDHPDRTLGLVLIGTPMTLRGNDAAEDLFHSTISKLTDPLDSEFVRGFADSTLAQDVPQTFLETTWEETMKVPARVFKEFFGELIKTDLSTELNRIRATALLVWGDQDSILSRREQDALAKALPNSRLVVYRGAGHSPHWEEPEHFASDLVSFMDGLGGVGGRDQST